MLKLARLLFFIFVPAATAMAQTTFSVRIDRGRDIGQSFGSLVEAKSDDAALTIGAGFQNGYNTRYRADRHAVQFFVRPADDAKPRTSELKAEALPRPNDDLCGAYLYQRDGVVYSTYGGLKSWDADASSWRDAGDTYGGTHETMRIGRAVVEFGSSGVKCNGVVVLGPPEVGTYQLFFYANGHLCFYHVHRGDGPYRPYKNDRDGFSKLYACPWHPTDGELDLSKAIVRRLPFVGETTFAWGQLEDQIVTGSNIGGFYLFEQGKWQMLLEPSRDFSYQLYSSVSFHDRLLMGQYPSGRVFEFDGKTISDLDGWPPVMKGVSSRAREAQTTVIFGGHLFVGVWPWGELWRYHPESQTWNFMRRMFDHPAASDETTHPYDVENRQNSVRNLWGQRVTSLIPDGTDLLVATSAKSPFTWDAQAFPFLAPDKWRSYGTVYRLRMPGHVCAPTKWTEGATTIDITIDGAEITIEQDGQRLASTELSGELGERLKRATGFKVVQWGDGIYGRFGGRTLDGKIVNQYASPIMNQQIAFGMLLLCGMMPALAQPAVTLTLAPSDGNPRNSEGDFVELADGRILLVYTRFSGGGGDHDKAALVSRVSDDQGRTWSQKNAMVVANEGDWNVMSVSLLRLADGRIALFYLRKNSLTDCRPYVRFSHDQSKSWSEPVGIIPDSDVGYFVLNNDRVIQMKSGRLVAPVALHNRPGSEKPDWQGQITCFLSDDGGESWRRSKTMQKASDASGRRVTAQEPGVVELTDGGLLLWVRTDYGEQFRARSNDGGETWSALEPMGLASPRSPATIERIPSTGDLLLVWNDHSHLPPEQRKARTPLTTAISSDDGATWSDPKTLEDDPNGWYCYTAMAFAGDHVLLSHCAGDRRKGGLNLTQVTRFPIQWLYE